MRKYKLPLNKPDISIDIDFGKGIKREYHLNKKIRDKFIKGEPIIIETCHPKQLNILPRRGK